MEKVRVNVIFPLLRSSLCLVTTFQDVGERCLQTSSSWRKVRTVVAIALRLYLFFPKNIIVAGVG